MARRPTREQTGQRVTRRAFALLDDLLVYEEAARSEVETVWIGYGERARGLLRYYVETYGMAGSAGQQSWRSLVPLLSEAVLATERPVRALIETAAEETLRASTSSLRAIARNQGPDYAEIPVLAIEGTRALVPRRVDRAMETYARHYDTAIAMFTAAAEATWRASAVSARGRGAEREPETADDLAERIFSPEQVRRPGASGTGAWWKPLYVLNRAARGNEFLVVNDIREHGMYEWNERAARVG